nr:unnamed protein product [Digitaria exilis]
MISLRLLDGLLDVLADLLGLVLDVSPGFLHLLRRALRLPADVLRRASHRTAIASSITRPACPPPTPSPEPGKRGAAHLKLKHVGRLEKARSHRSISRACMGRARGGNDRRDRVTRRTLVAASAWLAGDGDLTAPRPPSTRREAIIGGDRTVVLFNAAIQVVGRSAEVQLCARRRRAVLARRAVQFTRIPATCVRACNFTSLTPAGGGG